MHNGVKAPITFYSRTLSGAEQNYSQLDKEVLAAVAGVKRFHDYLYGRQFELVTDHKLLLGLLAGDHPTPNILPPCMMQWTIFLAAYNYHLIHQPGMSLGHANALSRCPLPLMVKDPALIAPVLLIEKLPSSPLMATKIARHSVKDKNLVQVLSWIRRGWPKWPVSMDLQLFHT